MGELPYFHGDIDASVWVEFEHTDRPFGGAGSRIVKATWEGGKFAAIEEAYMSVDDPRRDIDFTEPFTLGGLRLRPVGEKLLSTVVVQANDWSAPLYIWKAKARARWGWFKRNVWLTACVWGLAKYDRNRLNVRW